MFYTYQIKEFIRLNKDTNSGGSLIFIAPFIIVITILWYIEVPLLITLATGIVISILVDTLLDIIISNHNADRSGKGRKYYV